MLALPVTFWYVCSPIVVLVISEAPNAFLIASAVTSKMFAVISTSQPSIFSMPTASLGTPSTSVAVITGLAVKLPPPCVAPNNLPACTAVVNVSVSIS